MEDRALTAWDILERDGKKATEQLVVEEAADRLAAFDPRAAFKRNFSWHGPVALALLLTWILGAFFIRDWSPAPQIHSPLAPTARALRDFLQPLEEKAELQQLPQSLEVVRALQELAEKGLRNEISEETFSRELGQAMHRLQAMNELSELEGALSPLSRSNLEELGAEIAEFKRQLRSLPAPGDQTPFGAQMRERLGQLPRLEQALQKGVGEKSAAAENEIDPAALQNLLERLEAMLQTQMERLTQDEIQQFIAAILGSGEGDRAQQLARERPESEKESGGGGEKTKALGRLPGNQPGEKGGEPDKIEAASSNNPSQIKGTLGEGERSRVKMQGENRIGASKQTSQNVPPNYQRQVERDLASEEIPDGLKDTIKNYFLSLGGKRGS
jgi:hypothetical protein